MTHLEAPAVHPLTRTLTQTQIVAYARASGDFNPIHVDEAFARNTPLGGTIAHGMLVLAFISEMMTAAFGRAWLEGGRLDVRFRSPSRPGDTITARASAGKAEDGLIRYQVECVNGAGEQVISGTAWVKP
ncbi:MAG TPA: MaoC family dehydratase [Dehalococcoidia bacterium]|nr:MaoC family dehydratase [Dehalococcoidia bacterium]